MPSSGYVKTKCGNIFQPSTGKLFLFDDNSVSVLRGWPVLRAWKKTCVKHPEWIGFRPSLSRLESELRLRGNEMESYRRSIEAGEQDLPLSFRRRQDRTPYLSEISQWYFETTPREIRDLIRPFHTGKWSLMSFLAAGGLPAKELLQNSPAIAFMLANNRIFHRPQVTHPLRSVRNWLQAEKSERARLKWLGFPSAKKAVCVLGKIPCQDLSIPLLLKTRTLLRRRELAEKLLRQPVIDHALLAFFDPEIREMLTLELLTEVQAELAGEKGNRFFFRRKKEMTFWGLLRDTAKMFRQKNQLSPFPKVQNLNALYRLYDELSESVQHKKYDGK